MSYLKNKKLLIIIMSIFFSSLAIAETKCIIIKEENKIIKQVGEIEARHSPCSTFKPIISLMGYNEGILIDENHPEYEFKPEYTASVEMWKQSHNPILWMKNSCVWFSQIITKKLGEEKFKNYVKKFQYGNQNVLGDKGKNNGLTNSWLSSSLQISPKEQLEVINKLLTNNFPVSKKAHELTRKIIYLEELENGWKLYGKTGCGELLNEDGTRDKNKHLGWFIGWIEKDERKIVVIHYCEDEEEEYLGGRRARDVAKDELKKLILN